jgi:hypothetical protein
MRHEAKRTHLLRAASVRITECGIPVKFWSIIRLYRRRDAANEAVVFIVTKEPTCLHCLKLAKLRARKGNPLWPIA